MGYGDGMPKSVRIVVGVLGGLFLLSGLRWIFDPAGAAEGLGMATLPEGIARSTIIGDLGAFFLAAGTLVLLGALTAQAHWLQAASLLFGGAAIMRTLAWAMHGADFAGLFIAVEVVTTAILLFASTRES